MAGQFFVDESERRVYETDAGKSAGDVYLSRAGDFFWAIEQIRVPEALTLAQVAADAELWCFSGAEIVFKAPLSEFARGPASVSIVIPPCQAAGFVIHVDGVLQTKVQFKWRTASESEWDPPEMPEIEGA